VPPRVHRVLHLAVAPAAVRLALGGAGSLAAVAAGAAGPAAVLAGLLVWMGALTVASSVDIAVWERRAGRQLFADAARRRYAAPR
jgi:hypothetical protein